MDQNLNQYLAKIIRLECILEAEICKNVNFVAEELIGNFRVQFLARAIYKQHRSPKMRQMAKEEGMLKDVLLYTGSIFSQYLPVGRITIEMNGDSRIEWEDGRTATTVNEENDVGDYDVDLLVRMLDATINEIDAEFADDVSNSQREKFAKNFLFYSLLEYFRSSGKERMKLCDDAYNRSDVSKKRWLAYSFALNDSGIQVSKTQIAIVDIILKDRKVRMIPKKETKKVVMSLEFF